MAEVINLIIPVPADQHSTLLVDGNLLGLDELDFEVLQILIVEVEETFKRSIGYAPLALERDVEENALVDHKPTRFAEK